MTGKVGNPDRVRDLHRLAEIWQGLGLHVKETTGWEKRGHSSNITFDVLGCHHTAVPFDNDRILQDGDSTLEGPRCNVALHLNGDVVLVASGLAFHFGCATWPNGRSLGVEATGPQTSGPKFPNRDAYVALAAGFCIFKGNADPRKVVKNDVGIPVHLVAAHKEVAVGVFKDGKLVCNEQTRKRYGRKVDPDFDEPGRILKGNLAHGFSAPNGVRLIDTFRNDVRARMTGGGPSGLPPPAPKFPGTLRPGATGEGVRQVQRNLNKFLPPDKQLTVTGTLDDPTEKTLREWQKNRLIPEPSRGVVGPGTWEMLFAPPFSKNLQLNPVSKGAAVRQLKHALNQYGNNLDTTNEVFDGPTKTVVESWQVNRRQRKDGIVDMVTWYWIHAPHIPADGVPNLHPG